jgi:hypothetical protein
MSMTTYWAWILRRASVRTHCPKRGYGYTGCLPVSTGCVKPADSPGCDLATTDGGPLSDKAGRAMFQELMPLLAKRMFILYTETKEDGAVRGSRRDEEDAMTLSHAFRHL